LIQCKQNVTTGENMSCSQSLTEKIRQINQSHQDLINEIQTTYAKGQNIRFIPYKEMGIKNINQVVLSGVIDEVAILNHIDPHGKLKISVKLTVKIDKNHVYWLMHHEANFRGGYQPESTFLTLNALDNRLKIEVLDSVKI
jgi:hypothetical protein